MQVVDEIDVKGAGTLDRILDHEFQDKAGDDAADGKGQDGAPVGGFIAFEIIDGYDGRNGKQVQQVDTDRKPHHEKDKDDPFIRTLLVGMVLPFEDRPEYQGGEKGRGGINLALDGTVPIGIAKGVGQGADDPRAHDREVLLAGPVVIAIAFDQGSGCAQGQDDLTREMSDRPEQKKDAKPAGSGAHEIDGPGRGKGIVTK